MVLIAGLLTLAFRNNINSYIGLRMGYTYLSEESWRKGNTVAGIGMLLLSLVLAVMILFKVRRDVFTVTLLIGAFVVIWASTYVAKRTYELEDLRREAPEKPEQERQISEFNVRPYLTIQLAVLAIYLILTAFFWEMIPDTVAIHFDLSGQPDGFADKATGILIIPLLMWGFLFAITYFVKSPLLTSRGLFILPNMSKRFAKFMTVVNIALTPVYTIVLLYNVALIPSIYVNYAAFLVLAGIFFESYRLLSAR
nr:DUF1648 domain-containing protein [Thermococcus sp. GR6]